MTGAHDSMFNQKEEAILSRHINSILECNFYAHRYPVTRQSLSYLIGSRCIQELSTCYILMSMLMKPEKITIPDVKIWIMSYNPSVRNDLAVALHRNPRHRYSALVQMPSLATIMRRDGCADV
jgi:hypothetical protein